MNMTIHDLRTQYPLLIEWLISEGEIVAPRGVKTREIRNATLHFRDARECSFPSGIGRGVSPQVLAAEMLQWIAGVSDLKQLASVSSAFLKFTDDERTLYGAYGPRTARSMARAVEVLGDDNYSRQATVPIWRADERMVTKDLPCTVSWSFLIRDDKLHMTTFMRSNDVWTGVAYDVPIMGRIATAMAWALGVGVGSYTHHAQSLHIYETDVEKAGDLDVRPAIERTVEDPPFFDQIERELGDGVEPVVRWDAVRNWANAALFNAPGLPEQFEYYGNLLKDSEHGRYFCTKCRYYVAVPADCACPR